MIPGGRGRVLVVDAVALFHPEMAGAFFVVVWIDLSLEVATTRGKARSRARPRSREIVGRGVGALGT
ncbi:hypothetical protein GY21_18430 [Cryobacterium roopkundense]|uniref:Uncharacterized protein n=1 Tax=Cryobacterium roopkundense TaxID=1001240 RepID=A0A099J141_9MICO|nr:hypothetical protein GY21_18430 [Cryobacterium roopkundense]